MDLIIDLTPLLSGEKNRMEVDLTGEIRDAIFGDDLTFPQPIRVSGVITNQAGYLHLSAVANVTYEAACARCLAPIRQEMTLTLDKGVANANALNEENDDYLTYSDRTLVLDEAVGDALYLLLPYRHLCREDCAGFCDQCGKNLNEGKCNCQAKTVDPRLAVLGELLKDMDRQ